MISPTSTSTSTTAKLNPRCNTTSNIHPEDLVAVVLGGFNHNNQRLSDVEDIPASYVCSPLPDMPSVVTDAASVYIQGSKTIIICGGYAPQTILQNRCFSLSLISLSWTELPPNEYVYCIGHCLN